MFELDSRHIQALTDDDLRTLVGRLCEQELSHADLPISAVTYGGDPRAPDGGVDVRVALPKSAMAPDWVPRLCTVFQVKQEKAGRRAAGIAAEMSPGGIPRPIFTALAAEAGAYILVSGKENLSDTALEARRKAMRQAIGNIAEAGRVVLDFYDGHRIARWTSQHPGLVLWVRDRIGEPLNGWRPFGDWSAAPQPVDSEYLLDDGGRLFDSSALGREGIPIAEGLERMRAALSQPGAAVRLVGLSGMGKTRLVQALFDDRVGNAALDPALVVYADVGTELDPSPQRLLTRLARDGRRAVMIVDNCPPALHIALTHELDAASGALSLITVEYDVGDDEHENTTVFRLEPASDSIIERLVARSQRHIAELDRRRIVDLSEGNARLALALAETVRRGDSVARLSRSDLFNRLFHQRHDKDQALLRAAEACALVYSFDGETMEGDGAELPVLAELAGQTTAELHRHVAELMRRQLVQKRDRWRAVLPQALAIHLARTALENLPVSMVRKAVEQEASARLRRSFSRRIGFLHDSDAAQTLVAAWLKPDGRLGDVAQLPRNEWAIFGNVAPVQPDLALGAIQTAADRKGDAAFFAADRYHRSELVGLLHTLAYGSARFDQAAWLMIRALATEAPDNNHYSGREHVEALFSLVLSGTHASQAQRLAMIDRLLTHPEPRFNEIGVTALGAMLNAGHFSSSHRFNFGAHARDYGWQPKSLEEQAAWYRTALARAVTLDESRAPYSERIRALLVGHLRLLWSVPLLTDDLAAAIRTIAGKEFWPEGWKAVCATIAFDREHMPADSLTTLRGLEQHLRPADLMQMTHAYVLSEGKGIDDLLDTETMEDLDDLDGASARLDKKIQALGHALAIEDGTLDRLLPDLIAANGGRVHALGASLGEAASSLDTLWRRLANAFATTDDEHRDTTILRGFLWAASKRDGAWVEGVLDHAVSDPLFGPWFPWLQTAVPIGDAGVDRLHRSLAVSLAPASAYWPLQYGHSEELSDETTAPLVEAIGDQPGGLAVAMNILSYRVYRVRSEGKSAFTPALASVGRSLVLSQDFEKHNANADYKLSKIVKYCFAGKDAADAAYRLGKAIITTTENHHCSLLHAFEQTLLTLAERQPTAFLDAFVGETPEDEDFWIWRRTSLRKRNPLLAVEREVLFEWADQAPGDRYPRTACLLGLFPRGTAKELLEGDYPLFLALLDRAPDRAAVLAAFEASLLPVSSSGSLADVIEVRRQRLALLLAHADPTVRDWATKTNRKLAELASQEREWERTSDRRAQSFE